MKANFAIITAIISLIIAAATIVPDTIAASEGSMEFSVVTAIPVNTKDTPECGSNVNPRYLVTVGYAFVSLPPRYAPPILPTALEMIYIAVKIPAPAIRR